MTSTTTTAPTSHPPVSVTCPACNCSPCPQCPKCPDCANASTPPALTAGADTKIVVLPENKAPSTSDSFISLSNPLFLVLLAAISYYFFFWTDMGQNLYNSLLSKLPKF